MHICYDTNLSTEELLDCSGGSSDDGSSSDSASTDDSRAAAAAAAENAVAAPTDPTADPTTVAQDQEESPLDTIQSQATTDPRGGAAPSSFDTPGGGLGVGPGSRLRVSEIAGVEIDCKNLTCTFAEPLCIGLERAHRDSFPIS